MTEHSPLPPVEQFVETMGLLWETEGLPRIAGRLIGFLIVQAEPVSLDHMAAALGVSKASVSTDARRLEQLGLVSRVSRPGDRKDYYVMVPDVSVRILELKLASLSRFQAVMGMLSQDSAVSPVVRDRLVGFRQIHDRVRATLQEFLDAARRGSVASPVAPDQLK